MNIDKIGPFICELRKKSDLTQEQLAALVHIGREAVSKWERGITIPDVDSLQKLSEIFNVTINELLSGQKINAQNKEEINNVTLNIYSKYLKSKKKVVLAVLTLCFSIFIFLSYYFINSYSSISVYTITGFGEKVDIIDGIFINTKEKNYFKLGDLKQKEVSKISELELYYIDNDEEIMICINENSDLISFVDFYGYDEYIPNKNVQVVLENLYLKIKYADNTFEKIKLNVEQDYLNDNLFFWSEKKIAKNDNMEKFNENDEYKVLLGKIKEVFSMVDNNYIYEKKDNNVTINAFYSTDSNLLVLDMISGNVVESWEFSFYTNGLIYSKLVNKKVLKNFSINNNEVECLIGDCDDYQKDEEKMWQTLQEIL